MGMFQIRCAVVGAHNVGKTALIIRIIMDIFVEDFDPHLSSAWCRQRHFENNMFFMEYIDTPGHPQYENLLPRDYREADALVACFSLVDPDSFEYMMRKVQSLRTNARPMIPLILVGTKSDLRTSEQESERLRSQRRVPVSAHQIEALAEEMGAASYCVCSAKEGEGVDEVVIDVIKAFVKNQPEENFTVKKASRKIGKLKGACVVM
ncbi:P-loop containing nucleoside triphosphate hydrolase protein [Flagelloscypha sp. PMI_526]|nr:P-loop containing nucleoside triphosphate hydrolase protein [Flagelloscypha sp. PMI_526]